MTTEILQLLAFLPCIGVALLLVAIPVIGLWSRMKFAARIRELSGQGAYVDWGLSPTGRRVRVVAGLGIVSIIGATLWGGLFLVNRLVATSAPGLAVLVVLLGTAIGSGLALQYAVMHPK